MENKIFVGTYNAEFNKYNIEELDALCETNMHIIIKGFAGYAPVCYGPSREEVEKQLKTIREKKAALFKDFERAVLETISSIVPEETEVRIEPAEEKTEDIDSFVNDGITIIPEEHKGDMHPVVALNPFFRDFFANTGNYDTMENALSGVSEDIEEMLLELWNDPPECPYCNCEENA